MKYLSLITFDGTLYYGTQVQKDKPTINSIIEHTLSKILNEKITIVSCSRLDRGVHALNYYFHFITDKQLDLNKFKNSFNKLINKDIYMKSITKVDDSFHARYSVINKEYMYIINTKDYNPLYNNHLLEYNRPINVLLLKKASRHLLGTHDFKSFTSDKEKLNTIRKINYIKIKEKKGIVYIYINSNGFLRYMVRNIIGMLLDINENKIKLSDIDNILLSKDRTKLNSPSPSMGLYLSKVNYK